MSLLPSSFFDTIEHLCVVLFCARKNSAAKAGVAKPATSNPFLVIIRPIWHEDLAVTLVEALDSLLGLGSLVGSAADLPHCGSVGILIDHPVLVAGSCAAASAGVASAKTKAAVIGDLFMGGLLLMVDSPLTAQSGLGLAIPYSYLSKRLKFVGSVWGVSCSKVHRRGALSGRNRMSLVPWRKRSPVTWS